MTESCLCCLQEYLAITGNPVFCLLAREMALGATHPAIVGKRVATVQGLSGVGAGLVVVCRRAARGYQVWGLGRSGWVAGPPAAASQGHVDMVWGVVWAGATPVPPVVSRSVRLPVLNSQHRFSHCLAGFSCVPWCLP